MALRRRPALGSAAGSAALRARAERLTARMEALPRPPFVIAAIVAVAVLVAALAGVSDVERRVAEVGIFEASSADGGDVEVEGAEVEILEYGFGTIELNGRERLTVGAVVRNPNPNAVARITFAVTVDGEETPVESFMIADAPPGGDVLVARLFTGPDTVWNPAEFELTVEEASFESFEFPADYLPDRFTVVGIEPLLSPQGQRIVYRIESELDDPEKIKPDVIFRDADGAIVGGVGGDDHVVEGADSSNSIMVSPGTSVHHFNLRSEEIPEGADLLQTEIGPGGVIPGG